MRESVLWSYDLRGNLIGLPFRKGAKQGEKITAGVPADFDLADHSLTTLAVETWNGVIFTSFDRDVAPLRSFVGPEVGHFMDRLFNGRELTLLGYSRQRIPGNWKLTMVSRKNDGGKSDAVTSGITSFKENMILEDNRVLDV